MDEDISIINNETRKEKIINFFINNKKKLISILVFILLTILAFFSYQIYLTGHKESLANKYNLAVTNYEDGDKTKIETAMKEIINEKNIISNFLLLIKNFLIFSLLVFELIIDISSFILNHIPQNILKNSSIFIIF